MITVGSVLSLYCFSIKNLLFGTEENNSGRHFRHFSQNDVAICLNLFIFVLWTIQLVYIGEKIPEI